MQVSWARSHDGCVLGPSGGPPLPGLSSYPPIAPASGPDLQTSLSLSTGSVPTPQASGGPRPVFCVLRLHAACMLFFGTCEERFLHSSTFSSIHLFTRDLWEPVLGLTPQGPGDGAGSCADRLRL